MATRLSDLVICGELWNTRNYSTHGWLGLRGRETALRFELTGNCDPDLRGWHIRFEAPTADHEPDTPPEEAEKHERLLEGLAWQQIGPTGVMTAARQVKVCEASVRENYMRCKAGEPTPFEWKPCLTLEWFSQNGRVLLEMIDPVIDFVEFVPYEGAPAPAYQPTPQPPEDDEEEDPGLGITTIQLGDDGQADIREEVFSSAAELEGDEPSCECDEDPYGLFPADLQQQLDSGTRDPEDAEMARFMHEMELQDDLMENDDGDPLQNIVMMIGGKPDPDALSDQEAEGKLKGILSQLAIYGVTLDMCEHYTPRDALRLLVDELLPNERFHPQLQGTGWVQHFSTWEHCTKCEEQADREYEEYERKQREKGAAGDPGETADWA